jgi:hypothetical protein
MKTYLLIVLGLFTASAGAVTPTEEAIILNQELQFLQDSVTQIQNSSITVDDESKKNRALNRPSLERTYFGEDSEEDQVNTRTAGPKRRSL